MSRSLAKCRWVNSCEPLYSGGTYRPTTCDLATPGIICCDQAIREEIAIPSVLGIFGDFRRSNLSFTLRNCQFLVAQLTSE